MRNLHYVLEYNAWFSFFIILFVFETLNKLITKQKRDFSAFIGGGGVGRGGVGVK